MHNQSIIEAIGRNDIEFISYKLNELNFVNMVLNKPYI
jgi:hypothetical protein